MNITLRNDFHNSETTVRVASLPHTLTPSQVRRVRKALCGNRGCKCGDIRGGQHTRTDEGELVTLVVGYDYETAEWNGVGDPPLRIAVQS